jgi:hypothetical protein
LTCRAGGSCGENGKPTSGETRRSVRRFR